VVEGGETGYLPLHSGFLKNNQNLRQEGNAPISKNKIKKYFFKVQIVCLNVGS
jgi:hypothetical protein